MGEGGILFFDSGLGGVTILKAYMELTHGDPGRPIHYFADSALCPYGNLSPDKIRERCQEIVGHYLKNHDIALVVVACNTATTFAIDHLRRHFPEMPFVGVEPYIKLPESVKTQVGQGSSRVAIIMTVNTALSPRFLHLRSLYDPEHQTAAFPLRNLARLIEDQLDPQSQSINQQDLESELAPLLAEHQKRPFTHLILGCTHYKLIEQQLAKLLGCAFLDPGHPVSKRAQTLLSAPNGEATPLKMVIACSDKKSLEQHLKPLVTGLFPKNKLDFHFLNQF